MFHISTRLRFKRAHAKSQIPRRSHAQWCIDVFVNPVITSVIYIKYTPPAIQLYPKNYENKYATIQCIKLYCPRFGLSTFCMSTFLVGRCFDMSTFWLGLVCRRFGLSTFRSVDALVCWCFGMSTTFWFVDALVCRRFGFSTFWPATYKRVHFDTPNPFYKYGHHFAVDISEWISSMTFFIISLSLSFTS